MTQILRQSTQVVVRVGPFLDVTDGITPETGITLSGADEAELLKAAGAATVSIAGNTWAAIAGADGWYDLTLSTTDTNTVGTLDVVVQDDSECRPVYARFQVIEEAAYDGLYTASAGSSTLLPVNVEAINGDGDAADALGRLWGEKTLGGEADSGTTTTVVDAARTEADTDYWKGNFIYFADGSIGGQCRLITGFTPSTDTITFYPATTQAVSTNKYVIIPAGMVDVWGWLGTVAATPTTAGVPEVDVTLVEGADATDTLKSTLLTSQLTEAYAADGVAPTVAQALFAIMQRLSSFSISGTTLTVRKIDDSTTAMTFTMNDAINPSSVVRTT